MKHINTLLTGLLVLLLMSPATLAEEDQGASVELLELVAVGSVAIATVLSFMVATKVGGEMGNGLKVIAISVTFVGILREIFAIVNNEFVSEIFEISGGIGLMIGFYLLYKAVEN